MYHYSSFEKLLYALLPPLGLSGHRLKKIFLIFMFLILLYFKTVYGSQRVAKIGT